MIINRFGLRGLVAVVAALSPIAATAQTATVGSPLPRWSLGTVDIHQISTGRGNSALFILPDGTTLLVDAGAAGDGSPETDPHPNATRTPGDWIARYIKRHVPDSLAGLDYALLTHFHGDHYGQVVASSPASANGPYKLAGITQVGDALRIHTLIDRGWPDYEYPVPFTDSTMANYRRFLDAQRTRGMTVERFQPGSRSQLRLRHDAAKYPAAVFRNIIGNGEAWTGTGDATQPLFPPLASLAKDDLPSENMCSLAFTFSYGPFKYYTGGDLPGTADPGFPAWHAVEPMIAGTVGHVDVHVANQHASMGEESEPFLRALASTVVIVPGWQPSHPAPDVLKRLVNSRFPPAERFVYATEMRNAARVVIGQRASALGGPIGHVVVRVEPAGQRYWVIVVSNADESDTVLAVRGPFSSTSAPPASGGM